MARHKIQQEKWSDVGVLRLPLNFGANFWRGSNMSGIVYLYCMKVKLKIGKYYPSVYALCDRIDCPKVLIKILNERYNKIKIINLLLPTE